MPRIRDVSFAMSEVSSALFLNKPRATPGYIAVFGSSTHIARETRSVTDRASPVATKIQPMVFPKSLLCRFPDLWGGFASLAGLDALAGAIALNPVAFIR
jgi:hypothetical protein